MGSEPETSLERGRFKTSCRSPDRHGGRPQRSIRCILARFRTPTATASATCVPRKSVDYFAIGRRCGLAFALLPFPHGGFRLRHLQLSGHRSKFGTLADFDKLVAAPHEQNLRLLLDSYLITLRTNTPGSSNAGHKAEPQTRMVPLARSGAEWRATQQLALAIGGSAWEFDAASEQYYYHAFLKQPDLNWRNPPRLTQCMT